MDIQRILRSSTLSFFGPSIPRALLEFRWRVKALESGKKTAFRSFEPRATFVWIPKAAGSSFVSWLKKSIGIADALNVGRLVSFSPTELNQAGAVTFGHQSIDQLIQSRLISAYAIDKSFSFAIVRNPFTRAVSLWQYLIRKGSIRKDLSFSQFCMKINSENPRPGLYNQFSLSMASPMVKWIEQENWSGPKQIFKIEEMDATLAILRDKLGIDVPFPKRNVNRNDYRPLIDRDTTKFIVDFYAEDFEKFGYSIENPYSGPDS